MGSQALTMQFQPNLSDARLVMGFSGWMDGGDTSTGTIEYLVEKLDAEQFASIAPGEFYLYNFPGSMEMASLVRPATRIEEGVVQDYEEPASLFFVSEAHRLVLFQAKEPNLRWQEYAECIFSVVSACDVKAMYFMGSVAGLVPHTREVRFYGSVSDEDLKGLLEQHEIAPSNYEGPASFVTYLNVLARQKKVGMASVVAEIPAYVEGRNVKSIEAAVRKLTEMLDLELDLDELGTLREEFEKRLNKVIQKQPELASRIRELEKKFAKELTEGQEQAVREWFERQGIRFE